MDTIIEAIKEIECDIQEKEIEVQRMLNFGNVPPINWSRALRILEERDRLMLVLHRFRGLIEDEVEPEN